MAFQLWSSLGIVGSRNGRSRIGRSRYGPFWKWSVLGMVALVMVVLGLVVLGLVQVPLCPMISMDRYSLNNSGQCGPQRPCKVLTTICIRDHQDNLYVGEEQPRCTVQVLNPMIHCCDQCLKPILIYGRMIPCKHVFCLACAKKVRKVWSNKSQC